MKRFSVFISALLLAGFVTACGSTDAGITTSVKTKFAVDDTVKAYQIDVTTREGVGGHVFGLFDATGPCSWPQSPQRS